MTRWEEDEEQEKFIKEWNEKHRMKKNFKKQHWKMFKNDFKSSIYHLLKSLIG